MVYKPQKIIYKLQIIVYKPTITSILFFEIAPIGVMCRFRGLHYDILIRRYGDRNEKYYPKMFSENQG